MGVLRHVRYGTHVLWFTNMTQIRVHSRRMTTSIHAFLLKLHLILTPNISIKLKLGVVITTDEHHRIRIA